MTAKSLILIFLVISVLAQEGSTAGLPTCTITKQLATQVKNEFSDELGEPKPRNDKPNENCDELVTKMIDGATRLKNKLKQSKSLETEVAESSQKFHQNDEVKNFNATVHGVKGYAKSTYTKTFFDLNKNLSETEKSIKESLNTQLPLQIKLDLYAFINNHNELDLDENPRDTANTCSISSEKAKQLFQVFNEIRELTHLPKSEVCKDLIRQMINIRGLVTRSKKYQKNMMITIDLRFAEQLRLIRKFTNHIKESRKDYDILGDDLALMKAHSAEVERGGKSLKEFISTRAYETIEKSIQSAKNLNILNDAIPDCEDKKNPSPLLKALSDAYKCDKTKLTKVYNFLEKYNDPSKFNWLLAEMKKCNHVNELILLKVLKSATTQEDFKGQIELIYKNIGERLRKNDTNVANDVKDYKDFLDFHKIVDHCFDRNMKNFEVTERLIENADHRLFLEKDLTREIEFAEGLEFAHKLKLGFWLKSRQDKLKQDNEYAAKMKDLKEKKLPLLVQIVCFNSFSLISSESNKPLIRPGTATPDSEFQNLIARHFETSKGLYVSLHDSRHPDNLLCISNDGMVKFVDDKKYNNKCLWELKLTTGRVDCNNCVSISDQSNGKFLSSEYSTSCAEKNWRLKCVKHESFNKSMLPTPKHPNAELWKIN